MDQPTAENALRELKPLVGEWRVAWKRPGGEPLQGEGRVTFEWHESGAHLIQRSTVDIDGVPDAVSIIGCDAANGTYSLLYSDERGVCRIYAMTIGGGEWTLRREGAPFPQRFAGRFDDDKHTIVGRWEKAEDGADYTTDFDLVYTRVE